MGDGWLVGTIICPVIRRFDSSSVSKSSAGHHHDGERRVILADGLDVTPKPLLRREGSELRVGGESGDGSRLNSTRPKRPTMSSSSSAAMTNPPSSQDLDATRVMLMYVYIYIGR